MTLTEYIATNGLPPREFWLLTDTMPPEQWPHLCNVYKVPALPLQCNKTLLAWLRSRETYPPIEFWRLLAHARGKTSRALCDVYKVDNFPHAEVESELLACDTSSLDHVALFREGMATSRLTGGTLTRHHVNRLLAIEPVHGHVVYFILRAVAPSGKHVVQWLYTPEEVDDMNIGDIGAEHGPGVFPLLLTTQTDRAIFDQCVDLTDDTTWSPPYTKRYAIIGFMMMDCAALLNTPFEAEMFIRRLCAGVPCGFADNLAAFGDVSAIKIDGFCSVCGKYGKLTRLVEHDHHTYSMHYHCWDSIDAARCLRRCIDHSTDLTFQAFRAWTVLEPIRHAIE